MKIKKLVTTVAMATILSIAAFTCKTYASDIKDYVIVDYAAQSLWIDESECTTPDSKIYVSFTNVSTDKKGVTKVKDSTWSVYDHNYEYGWMPIDLSTLTPTKDNYITVKGNVNEDPVLIKIPATKSKIKATVNNLNATVYFSDVTDKNNPLPIGSDELEWRTPYGGWYMYYTYGGYETDLTSYQKKGATLYFRLAACDDEMLVDIDEEEIGMDKDGNPVMAYVTEGHFAGKETKIKISKLASGPKVTVDYKNHTFTIPATCEYRLNKVNDKGIMTNGEYVQPVTTAKTVVLDETAVDITKAGTLDVRTKAVPEEGKKAAKAASQITEVKFNALEYVTIKNESDDISSDDDIAAADITTNKLVSSEGPEVITVACDVKKKTLTFTNHSSDTYEIFVSKDGAAPDAKSKLTTIKAAKIKADSITPVTTKVSKVTEGTVIYIRKASNTKTKAWSTPFARFGTVKLTVEEEEAE